MRKKVNGELAVRAISDPFESFQWADYAAKPGYSHRYRVVSWYGKPGALTEGMVTIVNIVTEPLTGSVHEVHFNRGAIASQAFAKRFPDLTLNQAGAPAQAWLARDLLPALTEFIGAASSAQYSLHAAIYEFQLPAVFAALKQAENPGATVNIVDHRKDDDTGNANDAAIDLAKIRSICNRRVKANGTYISHY